jgi:hypothetical protein
MYAYCGNNPVDYRDRSGLNYHTYQYADPIGLPGHQYVSVDNPSGGAPITFSFDNPSFPSPTGPGKWSEGYDPSKHGYSSPTVNCYASTPAQDAALIKAFRAKIAAQADRYDFSSVSGYNCRTAEDDVIDNTLGSAAWTPDPPPPYVPLHLGANSGSGGFGM